MLQPVGDPEVRGSSSKRQGSISDSRSSGWRLLVKDWFLRWCQILMDGPAAYPCIYARCFELGSFNDL